MSETVASGVFEVTVKPLTAPDAPVGSMSLQKSFKGDLEGTSVGQMLAVRTEHGSAGYVAMEVVTATLAGRHGNFALQHSGTMDRGALSASISVIPDSGTDALTGLTGRMKIEVVSGQHHYALTYALPPK